MGIISRFDQYNKADKRSLSAGNMDADGEKSVGSPTMQYRKTWGLPSLWNGNKTHLPKLPECDDENSENVGTHFNSENSEQSNTAEPVYILSVQKDTKENAATIVMSPQTQTKEAPELTTPSSEVSNMVPHGKMEGNMRRNAQSFDDSMLGFVSEMPIPQDYAKQHKGFVSSLYGSFSELNIGKKTMSSQPSSAESSRCSSPTGFITDKVKESGITASPGKVQGRFGRLFRDLNATSPSQW